MTMGGIFATSPDIFSVNSNTFLLKEWTLVDINHKFSNFESLEFWKILNVIRFWHGRMYIKISYHILSNLPKWSLLYCYIGANKQDGRLSVIIFEIEFLRFFKIVLHTCRLHPQAHDRKTTHACHFISVCGYCLFFHVDALHKIFCEMVCVLRQP